MRKIYFLLIMLFIVSATWGQILAWQFNGAAGNEATANATTNDPNLTASTLSRGAGINASSLANTFSSTSFTSNGDKAGSLSTDDFLSFIVNAQPGFAVSLGTLDAKFRRSDAGPNAFRWFYSINGTDFTEIGSDDIVYIGTGTNGFAQNQIDLSAIPALQVVQSTTTITFRLYAWGATSGVGTFALGRSLTSTENSLAIGGIVVSMSPTPVELFSFAGQKEETKNMLRWTTASENNNRGFEVQYSKDGINYSVLAFVPSLAQGGFSTGLLHYSFADIYPAGAKHYYRLRQVDHDGRNKFSSVVLIRGGRPLTFAIGGMFPNPVNGSFVNVIIDAPRQDIVTLVVTDFSGRIFKQKIANVQNGSNTIPLDISNLSKGNYFVKLVSGEIDEAVVSRFIKQ